MSQEEFNGVHMIPFGLLICFVDELEVRVTELSEKGFCFRVPQKLEKISRIRLHYFVFEQSCYEEIVIRDYRIEERREQDFFVEYLVLSEQEDYRKCSRELIQDYWDYISVKLMGDEAYLSAERTGYPAALDGEHYDTFEEQKRIWFSEVAQTAEGGEFPSDLELAIELDGPKWYKAYLELEFGAMMESYWEENGLRHHAFCRKRPERIYIGNQFCHHLFPEKKVLFSMLEKSEREDLKVTISFSYLRDFTLEETENLLQELEQWCHDRGTTFEILVNDWGMAQLLRGRDQCLTPCLGVLLNKRRKDVRYRYKKGFWTREDKKNPGPLGENSVNAWWYREYLREELRIERYEFEMCGYFLDIPEGRHSLHLPFFQTNTSQYCPLYAKCVTKDRGNQRLAKQCPEYCREFVFLYPAHLNMVGRYNSLFGFDSRSICDMELLKVYRDQGIDRIVVNLM